MQIVKWCDDNNVTTDTKSANKTLTINRIYTAPSIGSTYIVKTKNSSCFFSLCCFRWHYLTLSNKKFFEVSINSHAIAYTQRIDEKKQKEEENEQVWKP